MQCAAMRCNALCITALCRYTVLYDFEPRMVDELGLLVIQCNSVYAACLPACLPACLRVRACVSCLSRVCLVSVPVCVLPPSTLHPPPSTLRPPPSTPYDRQPPAATLPVCTYPCVLTSCATAACVLRHAHKARSPVLPVSLVARGPWPGCWSTHKLKETSLNTHVYTPCLVPCLVCYRVQSGGLGSHRGAGRGRWLVGGYRRRPVVEQYYL